MLTNLLGKNTEEDGGKDSTRFKSRLQNQEFDEDATIGRLFGIKEEEVQEDEADDILAACAMSMVDAEIKAKEKKDLQTAERTLDSNVSTATKDLFPAPKPIYDDGYLTF